MNCLIVDNLKELRKSKKITQEQLAEKLDISRSKVSSWETNRRDMSITEAIRLANIYDTSLDNMFKIDNISENQYVEISNNFIKSKKISLEEKIKIIELIRDSLKQNNIDEFYEKYKMTQNATK